MNEHFPESGSARILMPSGRDRSASFITSGSGIVAGVVRNDDRTTLYYEGNLYDAENLKRWQARVCCAAGRMFTRYPTTAMASLSNEHVARDFEDIGLVTYYGSPRTPYLVHIDLEAIPALSAQTGEHPASLIQWAMVAENLAGKKVLVTGDSEIAQHFKVVREAIDNGNLSLLNNLNNGFFRSPIEEGDRICLYFNGLEVTPFTLKMSGPIMRTIQDTLNNVPLVDLVSSTVSPIHAERDWDPKAPMCERRPKVKP